MPRSARQALVSPPETFQIALAMPHCQRLTQALPSTASNSSVTMVEGIDGNRLARSQPMIWPPSVRGARVRPIGSGSCGTWASELMSALHQRDPRIVPVHEQADAEADGE